MHGVERRRGKWSGLSREKKYREVEWVSRRREKEREMEKNGKVDWEKWKRKKGYGIAVGKVEKGNR